MNFIVKIFGVFWKHTIWQYFYFVYGWPWPWSGKRVNFAYIQSVNSGRFVKESKINSRARVASNPETQKLEFVSVRVEIVNDWRDMEGCQWSAVPVSGYSSYRLRNWEAELSKDPEVTPPLSVSRSSPLKTC